MVSVFANCTEACGWVAAVVAVLSWGTFGVPIRHVKGDVNFFVMQSYKTVVCFVTSWLVILLGEPVRFTPWGIVSGLFWVPGAAAGIYGIRQAGISAAVGTWASIQVVVSFIFGIVIFQERVKDKTQATIAFLILMIGLVGMSRYSDPSIDKASSSEEYQAVSTSDGPATAVKQSILPAALTSHPPLKRKSSKTGFSPSGREDASTEIMTTTLNGGDESFSNMTLMEIDEGAEQALIDDKVSHKDRMVLFGGRLVLTKHQMGMLGAVINGAWGGMNLIPLHYAKRDQGMSGAGYLISFASGSMLVCVAIWIAMFVYYFIKKGNSFEDALEALPKWNIKDLGFPGVLAGLFYSVGNFCSILAVSYLGQGVGFSFCQGSLLVSGLWGTFYFHEITNTNTILKWFASALITIVGIVWMSYQHEGGTVH